MTVLFGNLLVFLLIAAAAAIMGRRALRTLRGSKTGCGCDHCPAVDRRGAAAAAAGRAGGPPPAPPPPAGAPGAAGAAGAAGGSAQRGA